MIAVITASVLFFLFSVFTVSYFLMNRRRQQHYQMEMQRSKKEFEQQLLQSQVEVQESTYRHIAKELHDNVGQLLSTTKMLMGITEIRLGTVPDTLTTASATLSKAIQEIRLLSRSLDKEWLEQFNFLENLRSEIARINAGETVCAVVEGDVAIAMKPEEQIILFRMVQEAIQNAIRHALPSRLAVRIQTGEKLLVQVINNGKPLPPTVQGMGTNNMRQRARLFGGNVTWQSAKEETIVTICLPLNSEHENQSRPG